MPETKDITKAVILVGGWGTRLRPLTYTIPKPLIPFCNRPMLKFQIEKLKSAGVKEIILAVNYYSELIMQECRDYENEYEIKIIYSKEEIPLGTAGPLALARKYLENSSFFVLNSDICCNADLSKMKEYYLKSGAIGTILVYNVDDPTRYGLVKTNGEKVLSFIEKPKVKEGNGPWLINAGMYIMSSDVLKYIEPKETSLEKEIFPHLVSQGLLTCYYHDGYWIDIGQAKDYLEGQRMYLKSFMNEKDSYSQSKNSSEHISQYESPYLSYAKNVVIGNNVSIGKNITLENCTIFDGVIIGDNSTIKNSIIGWDCVIGDFCQIEETTVLGKGVCIENNLSLKALKISPKESVSAHNIDQIKLKI